MAIDIEKHSEPKPAVEEVPVRTHPIVTELKKPVDADTETVFNQIDDKIHDVCAAYEGRVFDDHQAMQLKGELHDVPHVRSVGLSMLESTVEVVIQILLRGLESWTKVNVPVLAFNDAVVADKELEDNGGRYARRGGAAPNGIEPLT